MSAWHLEPDYQHLAVEFGSLDRVFALEGERITRDSESELIRVELQGVVYYAKRCRSNGKAWRGSLPRLRVKAEWENLQYFRDWGIPTAEVVAYGMERHGNFAFARGAMITREIPDTSDLGIMAWHNDPQIQQRAWMAEIIRQVAAFTRTMHEHGFVHNDLKWRNILVDKQGRAFLIDCPAGSFWWGPFLQYRIIKDLACLDKVAKYQLSRSQRLSFYLQYAKKTKLDAVDKKRIRKIVQFFAGRE